ncbi:IS1182 family transposase [Allohahella marinimesophila]|uniref:IS1182-like element ISMac1 family transposase n=1 Tax=Allohahella marinimesophila TaxID=1054972 RepID=A0ABP7QCR3_9GAMM
MPKFIPYNYDQHSMVVINYADQLQPGTFEHAVHYLISEKLDLSVFYPKYRNDEQGRPAYDPAILLKIVLFAYSKGITSSREMAWCCQTNILFKALSCDSEPHFTTIANFVSSRSEEIAKIFEQVLLVCHEQGLLGNELFAIDGCKLPSNAAKTWSGTHAELAAKRDKIRKQMRVMLKQHVDLDETQFEADKIQIQRSMQTLQTLDQAAERIDRFLKTSSPRIGRGRRGNEVKSNITDNDSAKMKTSKGTIQGYNGVATVDKKHQIVIDAQAFSEGQEQPALIPVLDAIRARYQRLGISDSIYEDGAVVTADTGYSSEANMQYLQAQNIDAYVPDNQFRQRDARFADQKNSHPAASRADPTVKPIFAASTFNYDAAQRTCQCPAGQSMQRRAIVEREDGRYESFEGPISTCRVCPMKHQCMKSPPRSNATSGRGRQVVFKLPPPTGEPINGMAWMKQRIDTEHGRTIYSHRMSVVEPVFGNITHNKHLKRFSLRGQEKVQSQWRLFCLVHNLEKLQRYGQMAA